MIFPLSRVTKEGFLDASARGGGSDHIWAIETLARDYIGEITLTKIDRINRSAQVGIVIGSKPHWNKGFGTDAMRVVLRFAFDNMNLHRVWLNVYDFNVRGIKSYEKCGFTREGVQRELRFLDGRYHDSVLMGILEGEYRATRKDW
jgi:RimJ/RimL family protein N-acetyltransferase